MNAWSREDIIIAYALYCVTPLGKINPSNKVIQQVAEIIPHSVASIVMRMRNFRYIDPKVSSGLKNVAKADRMIYEEFKHDWGSLSLEAETLTGLAIFDSSPLHGAKPLSSLTNHGRVSRERHFFKQAVLALRRPVLYIRLRAAANARCKSYKTVLAMPKRGGPGQPRQRDLPQYFL